MKTIEDIFPPLKELGLVRVAAAVPKEVHVGDVILNLEELYPLVERAVEQGVAIVAFPELCLTGYTCEELFLQTSLLNDAKLGLDIFLKMTKDLPIMIAVSLPLQVKRSMTYNVVAVCYLGKVLAFIPKAYLPNYKEFKEERYFKAGLDLPPGMTVDFYGRQIPFGTDIVIEHAPLNFSAVFETCEDGWMPIPPSTLGVANGAQMIFNLSASNELVGKAAYRRDFIVNPTSARNYCIFTYVSADKTESTSSTVFGGHSMISENGRILVEKLPLTDGDLLVADVDVEKMSAERRSTNTWRNWAQYWSKMFPHRQVTTEGRII